MMKDTTIDFAIDIESEEIYLSSMKKVKTFDNFLKGILALVSVPILVFVFLFLIEKQMM